MESSNRIIQAFSRIFSFNVMLTFLLGGLVWGITWGKGTNDPDIWWHIRNAEHLFQTHHLPNHDMYSFTLQGHEWINHSWLAEIPYYLAWRAKGLVGIDRLRIALAGLITAGILYLCWQSSRNFKASIVVSAFCVFLAVVSWGPRTILFGYLCLIALLIILERFRATGRGPLWLIPPIMCLWINMHGGWLFGLVVFGVFVAAGLIEGQWGRIEAVRWSRPQFMKLVATGLASAAAVFVNPYGWRLVKYSIGFQSSQVLNVSSIEEWFSVDFHDWRGKVVFMLLIALLAGALLKNQRWRLAEVGYLLLGLYLGLTYMRFLIMLAILGAPILARLIDFMPPYDRKADQPLINLVFMGACLYAAIHWYPPLTQAALEEKVAQTYPAQILPYLKSNPPKGRILNEYLWGGYLIWHARDIKVFVDSRVDIFEDEGVFKDYLDFLGLENLDAIVNKYNIRYLLLSVKNPMVPFIQYDPKWKKTYKDSVSILFEKMNL
jgi:hypothetical protein